MQKSTTPRSVAARRARKTAIAVALVCSLGVGTVHATLPVIDIGAIYQETISATNAVTTALNTASTVTNTLNTVTQLTSTLNAIASNPLAALIPSDNNMTELSQAQINELISAKCPMTSAGGNIVATAVSNAIQSLDPNSSIAAQQQRICSNTVFIEADEYNATVALYKEMPQLHNSVGTLQGMMQQLKGVMGNSASATAQTGTFTAAEQHQLTEWNTRVAMDKNIIDTLNKQQSILAAVSLNAKPDLLGSSVQAIALAGAFSIDN
jgi:hypothetical protein